MAFASDGFLDLRICDHAHNLHLVRDRPEHTQDITITLHKPELSILQTLLFGELFDDEAGFAQVVSGQAREEMMGNLEVETAVNELDGGRANNVHCRA